MINDKSPIAETDLHHWLGMGQLLSLVDLHVSLQGAWRKSSQHNYVLNWMLVFLYVGDNTCKYCIIWWSHMLLLVLEELIIIIIWGLSTSHTVTYQNQNTVVKSCRTLKYSTRSLQVTLFPPISFSTSLSGASSRGTSLASSLLKSSSMSKENKHRPWSGVTVSWQQPSAFIYYSVHMWLLPSPHLSVCRQSKGWWPPWGQGVAAGSSWCWRSRSECASSRSAALRVGSVSPATAEHGIPLSNSARLGAYRLVWTSYTRLGAKLFFSAQVTLGKYFFKGVLCLTGCTMWSRA